MRPTAAPMAGATANSAVGELISSAVAAFAEDFEDARDGEHNGPLLPPEDRLWRHPSEVASNALNLDPAAVRRRWLQTQPSKASAWTAGVVGALLATGLVILGTHLATAIAGRPSDTEAHISASLNSLAPAATPAPAIQALGPEIVYAIRTTGRSIASIDSQVGTKEIRSLALVVRANGMLIAPSAAVAHASSVLVTLANGVVYVGQIESSDVAIGITLLHINGVSGIAAATFASPSALSSGQMALAVVAPGGTASSLGTVLTSDTSPAVAGARIVDAMTTDLAVRPNPIGGPLVNASGQIAGVVIGQAHGRAVAIPTWLLAPVVQQLLSTESVTPGYLGLSCVTVPGTAYTTGGVRVLSVDPGSASAIATIQPGDLIVALDGLAVSSKADLEGHLHILKPGSRVTITVLRDGLERTLSTRLDGA